VLRLSIRATALLQRQGCRTVRPRIAFHGTGPHRPHGSGLRSCAGSDPSARSDPHRRRTAKTMSRPRRDRPSPRGPRRPAVRSLALAGLLPALLHLAGCSDGPTGPDPKPQPVYSLDVLGESPISATVAGTVTIEVRVRDGDGSPVAGATVHWRTDDGSGTIAPASSTTDADGIARADWTLGTAAGEQRAFARVEET